MAQKGISKKGVIAGGRKLYIYIKRSIICSFWFSPLSFVTGFERLLIDAWFFLGFFVFKYVFVHWVC